MTYFNARSAPTSPPAMDADEILGFIYERIQDRRGLSIEAKFRQSDVDDARAIAALAVLRMRQIVRRGRDPRACMLSVIAELEHLTSDLTGAKL